MTDNPWLSQPDATPYPTAFADPVAQRRIEQLEAAIGDLYQARDEAEMERDELRAKVAHAQWLSGEWIRNGCDIPRWSASGQLRHCGLILRDLCAEPLDAPLPPAEPSSLPTAPGTPNDATGGAE